MSLPEYEGVVMDMDGVVTRTASVHATAWKEMFDAFLEDWSGRSGEAQGPFDADADYREYVDGKPRYDGVRSFLESRGIELPEGDPSDGPDEETICGLGNRKNRLFTEVLQRDGADVFEDTVEQIRAWKSQGKKVAIFSSSRNLPLVLETVDLLDIFDARIDGNDLESLDMPGKPQPDMLLEAARRIGTDPSRAIVIEDAISGVEAGVAGKFAGVVGVDRGGAGKGLRKAGADIVVRDLREIRAASYCPPQRDCLSNPASATAHAEWIAGRLAGRRLALFLDYDGTLTPIVRRPEDATITDTMRSLIQRLSELCTVAIVSGRDRADAEKMVGIDSLVVAGSHGYDITGPDGLEHQHEGARRALPELDAAEKELEERLDGIDGARVERKRFAVAVHFREVENDDDARAVESHVDEVKSRHEGLRKMSGKKIHELQPDVEWDKGRAVMWLRETLGLDADDVVTMYLGDDTTDEDAFRALRRRGAGIGIRVGDPLDGTDAMYFLNDVGEVEAFLQSLAGNLAAGE